MSETRKRIVLDDYPAEKLPDDMRFGFAPGETLQITLEAKPKRGSWETFMKRLEEYHRAHPGPSVTSEEAVARIRALRDEWD